MPELKRELGLFDTFALVISAVVGAGIYAVTGVASQVAGPSLIASVLLAGVVAILTSMSIVQLVRAFPRTGGEYEYAYKTLSPFAGFLSGWMWTLNKVMADGAISLTFATYLALLLPSLLPAQAIAIVIVALVTLVNYSGVRIVGNVIDALVIATLSILSIFTIIGFFHIKPSNFQPFTPFGTLGILQASALIFFAYVGFARPIYLVEEIKDPERNVPRGMYVGLATSMIFYLLITTVAVGLAGSDALGKSSSPLATAISYTNFSWAPILVGVGALIATFSVLQSDNVGLSRMIFAMGRRGDYPKTLGQVEQHSRLPRRAIVLTGILTIVSLSILSFGNLVRSASFFILVYFALANLSSLRLGRRDYPRLLSVLGIVGTLGLAFSLSPDTLLLGVTLIAFGIVYFFARRGFSKELLWIREA